MSDLDKIRELVRQALDEHAGELVTGFVLAYETAGVDQDGDIGGGWGAVFSATQPTALGLCQLVARDIEYRSTLKD